MTFAALEINDQSLLIRAEDGAQYAEPGFARLTPDGVQTGEDVRSAAWSEPQHVYNQYWCRLNQSPLPSRHRFARHHADIAFAQLKSLWQEGGTPENLLLAVPGSFAHDQIGLLLGLVNALPCGVSAVVDSAVGACADIETDTLYVDLQLHETVLTACGPRGDRVRILGQEVFPGLGMSQIQNGLAHHVSNIMIESYRTDPLHSSETAQAIYDRIPDWLTHLCWESDVSVEVASEHGEQPCVLNRDAIMELVGSRLAGVRSFLDKWKQCRPLLAHDSGLLRGVVGELAGADVASRGEAAGRCLAHREALTASEGDLHRQRELRRAVSATGDAPTNGSPPATHVLYADLALPLSRPVSIRMAEDGPRMSNEIDEEAALTVVRNNRTLELVHQDAEATLPRECLPGESIRIGDFELKLIRVQDD